MTDNKIYFHLPEAPNDSAMNLMYIDVFNQMPQLFRENVVIGSVFGCFPVKWAGGRIMGGSFIPGMIRAFIKGFNDRGIPYRLTFTNPLITKEHLNDKESNWVLDVAAESGMNEVIVVSEYLEDYIRNKYPKMKITSSTCKCIHSIDDVKKELSKDYSLVVLDYNFNNQPEELEKLTPEERARCEILINAVCVPRCKRRAEHYRYIGDLMLNHTDDVRGINGATIKEWDCPHREMDLFDGRNHPLRLSAEDIYEKFVPMGFYNFKVEGRASLPIALLEQYVRFMAKPENRDEARFRTTARLFSVITQKK